MLININKNKYIINGNLPDDTDIFSTKIIDELPNDINEYSYKYINGRLVKDKAYTDFPKTSKELEEITNDLALNDEALGDEVTSNENNIETVEEALTEISEIVLGTAEEESEE